MKALPVVCFSILMFFLFLASVPLKADESARCRVPDALEGRQVVFAALGAVNNIDSALQVSGGNLYKGTYDEDRFRFVEYDNPETVSGGPYTYVNAGHYAVVEGEFEARNGDNVPFTLTFICRTSRTGVYAYSAHDRAVAGATVGRYVIE